MPEAMTGSLDNPNVEIGCAAASFTILVVYHVHLYKYVTLRDAHSTRGQMRQLRVAWVGQWQNKGMVPVNTLRDQQRACFYYGNAAVLLCTLVVGFLLTSFGHCISIVTPPSSQAYSAGRALHHTSSLSTSYCLSCSASRTLMHCSRR